MNNLNCVCVNIYSQLNQLLQTFQASTVGSTSYTHSGGEANIPSTTGQLGTPGRFSGDGGDTS